MLSNMQDEMRLLPAIMCSLYRLEIDETWPSQALYTYNSEAVVAGRVCSLLTI